MSSETVQSSDEFSSSPSLESVVSLVRSNGSEVGISSPSLPVNESTVSEVSMSISVVNSKLMKSVSVNLMRDSLGPSSVNSSSDTVMVSSSVTHPSSSGSNVPVVVSSPEVNSVSVGLQVDSLRSQLSSESGHSVSVVKSDPFDPVSVVSESPVLPEVVTNSPVSSASSDISLSADSSETPQVSEVSDSSVMVDSPSDHALVNSDIPVSVSSVSSDDAEIRLS